jgi:hypothetical protein
MNINELLEATITFFRQRYNSHYPLEKIAAGQGITFPSGENKIHFLRDATGDPKKALTVIVTLNAFTVPEDIIAELSLSDTTDDIHQKLIKLVTTESPRELEFVRQIPELEKAAHRNLASISFKVISSHDGPSAEVRCDLGFLYYHDYQQLIQLLKTSSPREWVSFCLEGQRQWAIGYRSQILASALKYIETGE